MLLSCAVLAGAAEVHAAFQAARDDEYEEIVDRCEDFLAQVKKEHVAGHYTYAELEENEVDLDKLQKWFARVRERDVFGAAAGRPRRKHWRRAGSRWRSTRPGSTPKKQRPIEPPPSGRIRPSVRCAAAVHRAPW